MRNIYVPAAFGSPAALRRSDLGQQGRSTHRGRTTTLCTASRHQTHADEAERNKQWPRTVSSRPRELSLQQLKQLLVVGLEKLVQLVDHRRTDLRVLAPFAGPKTPLVRGVHPHAVEPPRAVEVEHAVVDEVREAEEGLDLVQLGHGIGDESVAVHHVDLLRREGVQPPPEVAVVHADLHGLVPRVHLPVGVDGQLLEVLQGLVLGQLVVEDLRVVGHGAGGGVAQQHQQLHRAVHAAQAAGRHGGDEVAGGLLHGDLVRQGQRHQVAVPLQPQAVAPVVVEEVHLVLGRHHVRVQLQELEESARAALADPDDDAGREALGQPGVEGGHGQAGLLLLLQQLPEARAGQESAGQRVGLQAEGRRRRPHGAVAVEQHVEEGGEREPHPQPLTAPPQGQEPAHASPRPSTSVGGRERGARGRIQRLKAAVSVLVPSEGIAVLVAGVPHGGGRS